MKNHTRNKPESAELNRQRMPSKMLRRILGRSARIQPASRPEVSFNPEEPEDTIKGFKLDTIQHWQMPKGGRDLAEYEKNLLFDRFELEGKRVLDLGAGPQIKFAKELETSGINTDIVVSLSPDFSTKEHADEARISGGNNMIAATGQALPFKDGSFDMVLAFHVANHLPGPEAWRLFVKEVIRVLADGGVAKCGPLLDPEVSTYLELLRNDPSLMDCVKEQNVVIETEDIPEDVFKVRYEQSIGHKFWVTGKIITLTKNL